MNFSVHISPQILSYALFKFKKISLIDLYNTFQNMYYSKAALQGLRAIPSKHAT